jgi:hypothetical protein
MESCDKSQHSKFGVRGFILALVLPKGRSKQGLRETSLLDPKLFDAASDSCVEESVRLGTCLDNPRRIPIAAGFSEMESCDKSQHSKFGAYPATEAQPLEPRKFQSMFSSGLEEVELFGN